MSVGVRISVGLNVTLLAAVAWLWQTRSAQPPAPAHGADSKPSAIAEPHGAQSAEPLPAVNVGSGWQSWLEPLRRANVPAAVLADLVRADFDRRWQTRQAEMQQKYLHGDIDSDALAALAIEHDVESERDLAAALGPEAFREWDTERVLKDLPPAAAALAGAERATVYELERDLRQNLRQAELDKLHGTIDQATLDQRQQEARKAVAEKLRQVLGETRAAQLLSVDDTEGDLRRRLSGTGVTAAQTHALAEAQRSLDRTRNELVTRQTETENPDFGAMAAAAGDKFNATFENIAGPKALDEATQRADSRFNDLQRFAAQWKLSPTEAGQVYQAISTIDTAVKDYQRDAESRGVDNDAQAQAIRALQQQTLAGLTQQLGSDRIATLQRNGILPTP